MPIKTFQQILTEAVKDLAEHGYDSPERVEKWENLLRLAAGYQLGSPEEIEDKIRASLRAAYERTVIKGSIVRLHPGVSKFTIRNIEPMLRNELDKRILASAKLIKLNREKAFEQVLQRYSGWATSIPAGGSEAVDRSEVKKGIAKSLKDMSFVERRVAIDQGHKLISSISAVVAIQTGAIAAQWHQHFTQSPRKCHTERNGKIYAIRGNWALERGFMTKGAGYTDEDEQPAEFVFCRCNYSYFTNLVDLPPDMLTAKGKKYLYE